MDVRSFMLTTGQELVAEFVDITGRGYKIRNPLVAHMMRGETGVQLGFAPWSLLHKDDQIIELLTHSVLSEPVELEGEVASSYIQQQTGLILPPTGGTQLLHG